MKHMVDKVTALQDELNAYKNKTMVLSQEADAEIQGLQQQLSKYKKTSPANKADTPLNTLKKHYRRASYVQRLNNDVDSLHQSRYHHCNDACLMTVTATMVCSCGNSRFLAIRFLAIRFLVFLTTLILTTLFLTTSFLLTTLFLTTLFLTTLFLTISLPGKG